MPGVAQRTGSTVYYIELFPNRAGEPEPILALMPQPGDLDIVIASELMEAGRAILRGFVSADRTMLIGSTHRIYAIGEKTALGDGRASGERILEAAHRSARSFIGFDMDSVAASTGSLISAVMFGALAGSGALPFGRDAFEQAIRSGGKAVEANLAGFAAGVDAATNGMKAQVETPTPIMPTSERGRQLLRRIHSDLTESAHEFAIEGVRRLMDYQDAAYADLYLDRVISVAGIVPGIDHARLTREMARHLALWMSYEDTIRVADLKLRARRFARVREEVKVAPGQLLHITEYMHPRLEELCESLPASIGRRVLASKRLSSWLAPMFRKGRHVRSTSIGWFAMLSVVAGMRRWRRSTLRYAVEQGRIERWIDEVRGAAAVNPAAAMALVECQQLIKGYGETFSRGLANFERIMICWPQIADRPDAGAILTRLREAALADDEPETLSNTLADLRLAS